MSEKIKITIRDGEGKVQYELLHDPEKTLLETMREGAVMLPSLCGTTGKCGRCMVRFCNYAPLPAQTERSVIAPDKLREGYRLACMARPKRECIVEADFAEAQAAEEGKLQVVTGYYAAGRLRQEKGGLDGKRMEGTFAGSRTFVAADIGTTTIALQLIDGRSGSVLDTYTCLNPQRSYGTDVIARIRAAGEGHGGKLKELVRDSLAAGLVQLRESAKSRGAKAPDLLCIACNTAMGHILLGYPVETLGKSPFLPVDIGMSVTKWEGMDMAVLPGVSAFVGGDIMAGLYACGLLPFEEAEKKDKDADRKTAGAEEKEGGIGNGEAWLFMDLGTNAEMVMGSGQRMAATAAAAGPAFEGRGTDGATGPERIYAIAELLRRGLVDADGLLAEPYFETGADVEITGGRGNNAEKENREGSGAESESRGGTDAECRSRGGSGAKNGGRGGTDAKNGSHGGTGAENAGHGETDAKNENRMEKRAEIRKIHVAQEDIRAIQMAKAAVRAGIYFLMKKLSIEDCSKIKRVYIAGGMGFYLDREAAAQIGLLPADLAQKAETVGNTALAGACLLGRDSWQEKGEQLEYAAGGVEVFQMAELAEFSDIYIGYMGFDCNIPPEMV